MTIAETQMPNGDNPPPALDVRDDASLGHYLGWLGQVVYGLHHELREHLAWSKQKSTQLDERIETLEAQIRESEIRRAIYKQWADALLKLMRPSGASLAAAAGLGAAAWEALKRLMG